MKPHPTHSRLPFVAGALSGLACLAAVAASLLAPVGHPPLSHYVTPVAVPVAWGIAIAGLASAAASRRTASRRRYLAAIACNVAAIVAGFVIWFIWPFLSAA